jgi:flagellar motor component MotA
MEAINITAYPSDTSQVEAIKAVMKAFKIKFEIKKEKPYNPEFVAKILESREQAKKGQVTRVKKEDLNEFLGL